MFGSTIGIDIGSNGVRAVQVSKSRGKKPRITRVAEIPLDRGIVVAGEVVKVDELSTAIRYLWKEGGFSSKTVIVGMAGQQTMVRQVDLPWEPAEEFRDSLPLRVSNDLPVDPDEMTLDFYPLAEFQRGPAIMQRALIVAAVNAGVENTADALTSAKLRITRADFSPFALIRAAVTVAGDGEPVPNAPEEGEERPCEVVVDVGSQMTIIAIHDHGRPLFVRVVSTGSESVTRALADHLQIRFDEAEMLKRILGDQALGKPIDVQALSLIVPPQAIPVSQQIVNVMAGSLAQVVRESVEYFLTAAADISHVERVVLSGGGALLPGYAERLASELRAPAQILSPLSILATGKAAKSKELDPRMNLALGLALEVN